MTCRTVSAGQLAWTLCPSGLRGWTQVPLAQAAWVQIPQVSFMTDAHRANLGMDGRMEAHVNTAPLYSFLSFLLPFSVQSYYLFISFALPLSLSLSLSILLSLALSHYLSLSLFLLLLLPPLSPRPRVSLTRMLGSKRAARVHVERAAHPSTPAVRPATQS
jgi:hypothetical protein